MGKYIHLFETETEFNSAYTGDNYDEPWVSYTMETSGITYNKSEYEKLLGTPLTFKIISAGTIVWKASNTALTRTIEYKLNAVRDEDVVMPNLAGYTINDTTKK